MDSLQQNFDKTALLRVIHKYEAARLWQNISRPHPGNNEAEQATKP
jgi:hypothetical protein